MTLEEIHLALYLEFLTIYVCPEDTTDQWFIIPNPGFNGGYRLKGGQLIPHKAYEFKILASGPTPQAAYQHWLEGGRAARTTTFTA